MDNLSIKGIWADFKDFYKENKSLITVIITCAASMIAIRYYVIGGHFSGHVRQLVGETSINPELLRLMAWSSGTLIFYFLVPALVVKASGKSLKDYGFTLEGFKEHIPFYCMLYIPMLIAVIAVSGTESFQKTYPFFGNPQNMKELIVWEIFYALQFIALEFFFRGFMIHGLKDKVGNVGAVIIMMFPYMMIHFPKPFAETCGALIAGAVLGYLSIRTKSIAGGAMIHIMVAWTMDFVVLYRLGWFS